MVFFNWVTSGKKTTSKISLKTREWIIRDKCLKTGNRKKRRKEKNRMEDSRNFSGCVDKRGKSQRLIICLRQMKCCFRCLTHYYSSSIMKCCFWFLTHYYSSSIILNFFFFGTLLTLDLVFLGRFVSSKMFTVLFHSKLIHFCLFNIQE